MFAIEAAASAIGYCTLALLLGSLMTAGFLLPQGEPGEFRRQLFYFAAKLLPPKSASDKAKATIAHVASTFANSF